MRGGKLDRRVRVDRSTSLDDGHSRVEKWFELKTVWAGIRPLSERERSGADGTSSTATHEVRIRYAEVPDLTPKDRLVHDGTVHEIHGVREIGRREGWLIETVTNPDDDGSDHVPASGEGRYWQRQEW